LIFEDIHEPDFSIDNALLSKNERQIVQNPIFNIRGQNLSQRESGVFHYNVNGHIEMLKNEENPRMFVNFDLQKVKAKRILFYFDISGSMSSINKTLKPILKFVIDYKVKKLLQPFLLNFATSIYEEELLGNRTVIGSTTDSGTDPFNKENIEFLKKYIKDNRIEWIFVISDFEINQPYGLNGENLFLLLLVKKK